MCLIITVSAAASDRQKLETVSRQLTADCLRVEVEHLSRWPWARERPVRAVLSETGGCACSLLSDDADWNAEDWAFRDDVLDRLAGTLHRLVASVKDGVTVEALWIGDNVKETRSISAVDLVELARTNRLGTHTRYEVVS
jgi:hypothetical protein